MNKKHKFIGFALCIGAFVAVLGFFARASNLFQTISKKTRMLALAVSE